MWPDDVTTEHMGPRKRSKPHKRIVRWFTPQIAALYETGVLDMGKPMAAHLMNQPDYYAATDLKR